MDCLRACLFALLTYFALVCLYVVCNNSLQLTINTAWTIIAATNHSTLLLSAGTTLQSTTPHATFTYSGSELTSLSIQTLTSTGERIHFSAPTSNGFVRSSALVQLTVAVCVSGLNAALASNVSVLVPAVGCVPTDNYNGCMNNQCSVIGSIRCVSLQTTLQCDCKAGIGMGRDWVWCAFAVGS